MIVTPRGQAEPKYPNHTFQRRWLYCCWTNSIFLSPSLSASSWGLTVVYESKKQERPERQQWWVAVHVYLFGTIQGCQPGALTAPACPAHLVIFNKHTCFILIFFFLSSLHAKPQLWFHELLFQLNYYVNSNKKLFNFLEIISNNFISLDSFAAQFQKQPKGILYLCMCVFIH